MKYSGIDLHSNNSMVTVTDEQDRVVVQKRVANELSKIVAVLLPWRAELAGVVVESTFNWYWLVDGLQDVGFKVHLANTTAIKKYEGLKHSGDDADARYLAHLLRLGILPTAPSCRRSSARCAISRASACSWCVTAPRTSSPSRTSPPVSTAHESAATRSSV
jgi:transposase